MVQRLRYGTKTCNGSFGRKQYMSPDGNIGTPSTPDIGGFYLYQYDPKWKDKLLGMISIPWYFLLIMQRDSMESMYIIFKCKSRLNVKIT